MRLSSGDHAGRASARTRHRKWLRSGLAAVLSMATLAALAAPASATDTMPWGGQYADTSHPEQSAGANQPYQHGYTGLDILNWNPDADKDSEYLRSRVPLQTRIAANAACNPKHRRRNERSRCRRHRPRLLVERCDLARENGQRREHGDHREEKQILPDPRLTGHQR